MVDRMKEQILFVCTANICRSPMAQAFLSSELERRGRQVDVCSAGLMAGGKPADKKVVWVMGGLGFDVSGHLSTKASGALQRKPDLILVMAREHLRALSELEPGITSRAFTLKEFVQLAWMEGERHDDEPISAYLERLRASRSISAITSPDTEEDVTDPIGRRKRAFARCASELQSLVREVADMLYPSAG